MNTIYIFITLFFFLCTFTNQAMRKSTIITQEAIQKNKKCSNCICTHESCNEKFNKIKKFTKFSEKPISLEASVDDIKEANIKDFY